MTFSRVASYLSLGLAVLITGTAAAEDFELGHALALGDSVVFGYITEAGYEYVNPSNFVGSPEFLQGMLHVDEANAGCPGETTGSLLSASAGDNGCRRFRTLFPLHVAYTGTQLEFATAYLKQHRDTRLVTVGIGANDIFLLQSSCASNVDPTQCIQAGLPAVLATAASNVATLLAQLRATGYAGTIIVVNYYSLDYSDPLQTGITAALNQAIATPAPAFGAVVADVFTAFQGVAASPLAGGKTCNTGLLNVDPQNPTQCDVHPTLSGQRLIARTVATTYRATAW